MQNELKIFENTDFGEIRTVAVDEKPYFVGVDVARALEYAKPSQAVINHCRGILKLGIPSYNQHGAEVIQETNVIPEGDIYRLIIKAADQSKNMHIKEKAEKFEKWVFDEILPQIRLTGVYQVETLSQLEIIQQSLEVLTRHDDEITNLKDKTTELERKIDVIGAYENSMQYKQLCKLCSARVKELLNYQVYFCLWSPFFYKAIHSQLSREFLVASTKLIKTQDLEAAKNLIRNWFPSDYYIKSKTEELIEKRDAGVLKENRVMALHIWLNDSDDGNNNLFSIGD